MQVGSAKELQALDSWLSKWESIHITHTVPAPKGGYNHNPGSRAALLSGPPGIGETAATA